MVKTKLLFLFTIFTIVIAVPPKPNLSGKLRLEKFVKELELSAKYEAKQDAPILSQRSFILPNNTEPISYNVRISTDIHRGDFGYQGDVTINIRTVEATNTITLKSRHTIIEQIDLFNPNGTLYQGNAPFLYDSELNFLEIRVIGELVAGQELIIEISYQGFIRNDRNGIYRNSYIDPVTNEEIWLATTQLWPVHTRHAFPCYDEPRYRTPITLQIRHHQNYSAISNMPVAALTADGDYVITAFEETPPIPTYSLSFTISNFDFVETTDINNATLRVYARPEAIQLGQADDGLRIGEIMLTTIQELFEIPYPLPKLDQIAIPLPEFGGYEGLGLISHWQNIVLQLNNNSAAQRTREVRIGHETSHIYFGNLVTPTSFTYFWLNEALARLYENVLITIAFPEVDSWQLFLMELMDEALAVDVQGLLAPLNLVAESPEEILGKLNFGTWNKGAIVLRTFEEAISSQTWLKGVRIYLSNNLLGNVTPQDLYDSIQEAYDEDFPGSGLNFTELMSPWFDFSGFPIVTVTRNAGGLVLTQEGFRTVHNELFNIPINYATASYPEFENTFADFWMTTSQLEISRDSAPKPWTDDDWIIVNLRDSYYFLTNYDDNLWDLIIDALNNEHEAIHFLNRGTLFADFHRFLIQDFNVSIIFFLRMMESLPLEFHPHVWNRGALGLALAEVRIRGTEFHQDYLNFVQNIMSQIYGQRSFDDRSATDLVNDWSCLSGVQQCLDDALNILLEAMETGVINTEFDYQCNGLRAANESVWTDFYYSVVDSNSTNDRSNALRDLLCNENETLVSFYLNQALNTTNSLSIAEREIILTTAAIQHYTSFNLMIYFIERNSEAISEITNIPNLILELALVTNNYIQEEQILSLLQFIPPDDVLTEQLIVDTIQPHLNFYNRNINALRQWFEELNGKSIN